MIDSALFQSLGRIDEALAQKAELALKGIKTIMLLDGDTRELLAYIKIPKQRG